MSPSTSHLGSATRVVVGWLLFFVLSTPMGSRPTTQAQDSERGSSDPDLKQIIDRLKANEDSIRTVSVGLDYSQLVAVGQPKDKPQRGSFVGQWYYERGGRARYEGIVEQTRTLPSVEEQVNQVRKVIAAFDGTVARTLETFPDGRFRAASLDNSLTNQGIDPREITTQHFGKLVSALLADNAVPRVQRQELGGAPVLVIDTKPVGTDHAYKSRYWVDPARGWSIVKRAALIKLSGDDVWQEYSHVTAVERVEVNPGVWLPSRFVSETYSVEESGSSLAWRYDGRASDWRINQPREAEDFELVFPSGATVNDNRPAADPGPSQTKSSLQ